MASTLKNELRELEKLILSVHKDVVIDDSNSKKYSVSLMDEVDRVKHALTQEVFAIEDERHLERYIQYHQQVLVVLLDKIEAAFTAHTADLFTVTFALECLKQVENLLSFIERYFAKYFDQDSKAPDSYLRLIKKDATSWEHTFKQRLLEMEANSKTADLILTAFRKFVGGKGDRHSSYRMIMYVKEFQKEFSRILKGHVRLTDQELWPGLFYLNYNSISSFYYFTQIIDSNVASAETAAEKIELLSFNLKRINQAQVKPGVAYNPQAESLKTQIASYVIEEIEYLERVTGLQREDQDVNAKDPIVKLVLDLSVAQVALIIKAFVECKILLNANTSDLLRTVTKVILTKRSENISFDSIRSKYYNIESSTRDTVHKILLRLASAIEKMS